MTFQCFRTCLVKQIFDEILKIIKHVPNILVKNNLKINVAVLVIVCVCI